MAFYAISIGSFQLSVMLQAYREGQTAFCPHSWYVWELMALSVLFYLGMLISRSRISLCVITVALTSVLYIVLRFVFKWPTWWTNSTFVYALGVAIGLYRENVLKLISTPKNRMTIALLWGFVVVVLRLINVSTEVYQCSVAVFLFFVFCASPIPKAQWSKPLWLIGSFSYELYLVHGIVRNNLDYRLSAHSGGVRFLAVIAATILAGYLYHRVTNILLRRK